MGIICNLRIIQVLSLFLLILVIIIGSATLDSGWQEYDILELFEQEPKLPKVKVAIALLVRRPVDFPIWLKHHRHHGVSHFFVRLEDSPGWEEYFASQPDVTLEIAGSDKKGNNYETLMHRQKEYVNKCMEKARAMEIDWVFHVDSDELIHGSLAALDELGGDVKCVRIENAEAIFKEDEDTCFSAVKFLRCGKKAPCRSYINGKGAGRAIPGVSLMGPHHFGFEGKFTGPHVREIPFEKLHVLHFDSCSFGSWAEKFQHLNKNKKENVPFTYYKDSMDAVEKAYNVYKKYNMEMAKEVPSDLVYVREG